MWSEGQAVPFCLPVARVNLINIGYRNEGSDWGTLHRRLHPSAKISVRVNTVTLFDTSVAVSSLNNLLKYGSVIFYNFLFSTKKQYYTESQTVFDMSGFKNRNQRGILPLTDKTHENNPNQDASTGAS